MKTISNLIQKASEKGYAKQGSYEMDLIQGYSITLLHYGTWIVKIDFTTNEVKANSTSQSDSRAINSLLAQYGRVERIKSGKLAKDISLATFKDYCKFRPSLRANMAKSITYMSYILDNGTPVFIEKLVYFEDYKNRDVEMYSYFVYDESLGRYNQVGILDDYETISCDAEFITEQDMHNFTF